MEFAVYSSLFVLMLTCFGIYNKVAKIEEHSRSAADRLAEIADKTRASD